MLRGFSQEHEMKNISELGFTLFAGAVSLIPPTMVYLTLFG
jgi:hypothetical protein